MSSGGTQSPPLEYTGSHIPMGVSSIDGSVSEPMLDAEQRKSAYHPTRLLYPYSILNILAYFAEPELVSSLPRAAGMHVIIS
ncbi:uncharacterized protein F5147DRAFT_690827 [Suillus discolor]|uniref:Uncharacterized protein n=1 Tax=Suillus discolor TaxID=1912936 RepID=A0A9P7F816_9AGAM|nr:uncharacterized protein F5147DRAFT_690827 [Suillus discolor]KAG2109912.1 hypothetical protein F5147DRAFT_690827 [Suillus discolor]